MGQRHEIHFLYISYSAHRITIAERRCQTFFFFVLYLLLSNEEITQVKMSWLTTYDEKVARDTYEQLNITGITENAVFTKEVSFFFFIITVFLY